MSRALGESLVCIFATGLKIGNNLGELGHPKYKGCAYKPADDRSEKDQPNGLGERQPIVSRAHDLADPTFSADWSFESEQLNGHSTLMTDSAAQVN